MKVRQLLASVPLVLLLAGCDHGGGSGTGTVTIRSSFPVPAGQEVTKCMVVYLHNEKPFDFGHIESHMSPGSHHLILYTDSSKYTGQQPPAEGLQDCDMTNLYVYGAQEPDHYVDMPTGIAGQLPANTIAILEAHYVNATGADLTANVDVELEPYQGTPVGYSGVMFFLDDAFSIPPGAGVNGAAPYEHSTTCEVPEDVNVFRLGSHQHHRGLEFDITRDAAAMPYAQTLYQNRNWESPLELRFPDDQPLQIHAHDQFTFDCSWQNETNAPVEFGLSALTNEMCIMGAGYYPRMTDGPYGLNGLVFCYNGQIFY